MLKGPGREIAFDGRSIGLAPEAPGRRLLADERCFAGPAEPRAWASVCALVDPAATVPFDAPEVQRARQDALAWWIPLLGEDLICLSTFTLDSVRCGGAVTVVRRPRDLSADPFARLFPATVIEAPETFTALAPPAGPVIERYAGAPWPGGSFGD